MNTSSKHRSPPSGQQSHSRTVHDDDDGSEAFQICGRSPVVVIVIVIMTATDHHSLYSHRDLDQDPTLFSVFIHIHNNSTQKKSLQIKSCTKTFCLSRWRMAIRWLRVCHRLPNQLSVEHRLRSWKISSRPLESVSMPN